MYESGRQKANDPYFQQGLENLKQYLKKKLNEPGALNEPKPFKGRNPKTGKPVVIHYKKNIDRKTLD